jgi:PAS domain S-box-containing protein
MTAPLKIIIIEDNPVDVELIEELLSQQFHNPRFSSVDCETDLLDQLENFDPSIIISDYSMPGFSGTEALEICYKRKPDTPFIFVSGTIGEERAVEALQKGAVNYVLKSNLNRLPHAIQMAVKSADEQKELEKQQRKIRQLSMVARQIDNGVWIGDGALRTVWINHALTRQTGYTMDDLNNSKINTLFAAIQNESLTTTNITESFKSIKHIYKEIQIRRKDKTTYWASVEITPVIDDDGEIVQVMAVINDITQRKEAELERDDLLNHLELKVEQRTNELKEANEKLENSNREILESIRYARLIQEAFIPPLKLDELDVKDAFILNLPKDVLSGDFHWQQYLSAINCSYFAVGDCTGHGVPGSLMTMLAIQYIEQAFQVKRNVPAKLHKILMSLDKSIVHFLRQRKRNNLINDGLEIMLLKVDYTNQEIHFSGAGRPIYVFSNGGFQQYESPNYAVGGFLRGFEKTFKTDIIKFQPGDRIYAFSDGFEDQFGGPKEKKYSRKRKIEFLKSIQELPFSEHKSLLKQEFYHWKGDVEQIDDVIAMGIEL